MKSTLLKIAAVTLIAGSANAQNINVPTVHKTLVSKYTADWCPPCGGWGWDRMEAIVDECKGGSMNAVAVAIHTSSSTNTSLNPTGLNNALRANLDVDFTGIPSFTVGNKNHNQAAMSLIQGEVTSATTAAAVANAGFTTKFTGDNVKVDVKTTFFKAASGEFWVGVYAYETDIVSYQNPKGNTASHKNVLRALTGMTTFGKQISGTSFTANQSVTESFDFTVPSSMNKAKMTYFTIVWEKKAGKYEVVNVNNIPTFATGVNNVSNTIENVSVYPNPASGMINVNATLPSISDVKVSLVNAIGQIVLVKEFSANSTKFEQSLAVDNLANGVYIMNIESNGVKSSTMVSVNH